MFTLILLKRYYTGKMKNVNSGPYEYSCQNILECKVKGDRTKSFDKKQPNENALNGLFFKNLFRCYNTLCIGQSAGSVEYTDCFSADE